MKRIFKDEQYFCIITTCKDFQVLRFFYVSCHAVKGNRAVYFNSEVAQNWITPDGKNAIVARIQNTFCFGEKWDFKSGLEIRPIRDFHNINPYCIYPYEKMIPELKRRGYSGMTYKLTPFDYIYSLLTCKNAETLLKAGQTGLFYHFARVDFHDFYNYWASIKICIRNGYQINDAVLWCDYIDLLRFFEKDLHNAKYVCPADLKTEHDRYVKKKSELLKRQQKEKAIKKLLEDTARFNEMKARFFGVQFDDGLIQVRILESVEEIKQEGEILHHCVFVNNYHLKPDSLILSATIGDKRLETVEFSLLQFKVLQSRGVCNNNTEYHDKIINLVEKNIPKIKKRMVA